MNPVFALMLLLMAWIVVFVAALLLLRLACSLAKIEEPGLLRAQLVVLLGVVLLVPASMAVRLWFDQFEPAPAVTLGRWSSLVGAMVLIFVPLSRLLLRTGTWSRAGEVAGLFSALSVGLIFLIPLSAIVSIIAVVFSILPVPKVPFRYNLRNLQVRWKTSLVTALAFTLVISLLTVMLAFVKGMDKLTEGSGIPGNVMILADGATDEAFSSLPKASVHLLPSEIQELIVKDQKGEFLATQEVYVICTHTIPNSAAGGRKRRFVQMRGLDNAEIAAQVHQIELASGTWFSPAGVRAIERDQDGKKVQDAVPEIVLGDGIARTFGADVGRPTLVPGDVVQIGGRFWYVNGVMKPNNSAFGSEIWAKDTPVAETFGRVNSYSSYVVRTASEEIALGATKLIREVRSDRALQAYTERQYYSKLTQTNDQFRFAILFVAVIMAIGGVLGVMNTMFAAISQRTKDIGVLRLLGYTNFQVLCSFLAESLAIAFIGGVLGLGLGYFSDGLTASSIVSGGQGGGGKSVVLRLTVDHTVLMTGLIFTFLMGAVGGLIPSLSAMRLKPLESLR